MMCSWLQSMDSVSVLTKVMYSPTGRTSMGVRGMNSGMTADVSDRNADRLTGNRTADRVRIWYG